MFLTKILTDSAQQFPDRPALRMLMGYRQVTLTYAQVLEYAQKVAVFLQEQGLGKGDPVILCASNSPYWVTLYWGCLLRGCIVVPLAVQSTQETVNKIASQVEAKLFFRSFHLRQTVAGARTLIIEHLAEIVASCDIKNYTATDLSETGIALIMYTSGTTGDPKGVVLTHNNIASNVAQLQKNFRFGPHERILSMLPLSHMLEQTIGFLLPYTSGSQIIYVHAPSAIRNLLMQHKITKIATVPEFLKVFWARMTLALGERGLLKVFKAALAFSRLVHYKPVQRCIMWPVRRMLGGKLDLIATGGAPLDLELLAHWDALGISVLQGYGLTETSPVIANCTLEQQRIGSVGKPLATMQVRLSAQGEIEVRGPSVFSGYFKDEEKTRDAFTADGWFKTGDIGAFDKDGFLFLKGRKKYMIKGPGAENIYPEDIEAVLNEIDGVKDSCIIGLEKDSGMVEIHAVLLLAGQAPEAEAIVQMANKQLAPYQHITGWSVWPGEDFARTVTRKIKKEEVIAFVRQKESYLAPAPAALVSPLTHMLAQIAGVDVSSIHPETKLTNDLKFDSLMRIELVSGIEEVRGVTIDETLITSQTTVADLEAIIKGAQPVKKVHRVKSWPRWWWARGLRRVGYGVFRIMRTLFCRLQVKGLENLNDLKCPVIFMPNHVSMIDGLIVVQALPAALRRRLSFAAAQDVLYGEYKWASWFVDLFFNTFPFPRREHDHIATGLLNMGTMLDSGYSVVIFPEGHVSHDGRLQELKRGAGLVAVEMNTLVIPVHIEGLDALVPYDHIIPKKRGPVTVTFGKPLKIGRESSYDQATALIGKAMEEQATESAK